MLGAGRPAGKPEISGTRELSREEVVGMKRGTSPVVKAFRDSHHRMARLVATGLRTGEVAERTGYSLVRVATFMGDPAFQDLIAHYRGMVDETWKESVDEYYSTITSNRILAARLLNDKLVDADPDDVSIRELVLVHADAADRTGYPKRTVAVNVNVDFAAQLDRAIKRSHEAQAEPKTIDVTPDRKQA